MSLIRNNNILIIKETPHHDKMVRICDKLNHI
jgi:hypothetical protein